MSLPDSAKAFVETQKARLRGMPAKRRIVFPEGSDPRVRDAAARLRRDQLIEPILLDATTKIPDSAWRNYARIYLERRRSKGITEVEAAEIARRPLFTAALMVAAGDADGFVGGAVNTSAETVRAALHCIGTAPSAHLVSSAFIIALQNRV